MIIVIVIALVILSFLGFHINDIITAPALRNFFMALWDLVIYLFGLVMNISSVLFTKIISLLR